MTRILNTLDNADLRLADGRRLIDMRVSAVWQERSALGMPVTADMGKAAMLEVFKQQFEPALKKLRPGYGRQPVTVDEQVMSYAARMSSVIADTLDEQPTRAPMRPIASTATR